MRFVGFWRRIELSGFCLSTSSTSDLPNAWMRLEDASGSGKRSLVGEATPSGLWQARHPAFSNVWYSGLKVDRLSARPTSASAVSQITCFTRLAVGLIG